jgi:hypothetical protein
MPNALVERHAPAHGLQVQESKPRRSESVRTKG